MSDDKGEKVRRDIEAQLRTCAWDGVAGGGAVRILLTVRVYSFILGWLQHQSASFKGSHWPEGQTGGTPRCSSPNPRELRAL